MLSPNLRPVKLAMRKAILAQRNALAVEERERRSAMITARLLEWPALIEAEYVLLFASFGSEVITDGLMAELLGMGKTLLLPRVNMPLRTLDLYEVIDPVRDLQPGAWKIREPVPGICQLVSPREVEFVLVPGVAFDCRGGRLGYGGGFYDDLLARLKPRLPVESIVAAVYDLQIVPEVPVREKDIRVPYVMTEKRLIKTCAE